MPAAGFATRPAESGNRASGGDPGRLTAQEKVWMLIYKESREEAIRKQESERNREGGRES